MPVAHTPLAPVTPAPSALAKRRGSPKLLSIALPVNCENTEDLTIETYTDGFLENLFEAHTPSTFGLVQSRSQSPNF